MKHFNFKKLLLLFAVIVVMQSGSILAQSVDNDTYLAEGDVSPLSDLPLPDEDYT